MTTAREKSPDLQAFLDHVVKSIHGHTRTWAFEGNVCLKCGSRAEQFRDELSRREYGISGTCQECQDEIFKMEV